ncbi:cell division/cell wall cluster transcriptional repressor MraZ [Mycoplasma sp. M5725]|uniref:Transcriptional regulator MraZ n=1 Tax=Mycoplasma phocimorsus TaxID=3045839 RepID=A0AAJ1UWS9_9MOLU|nr:cell division/cell wall cluster transcriptional repressor MraZ [Mycoplasma phocimorsus]MDJ1645780.1 cell division/cell wall cluster transcriptional repressor MraZ [Mycoplasma phocimorsus]
MFFSQFERTLDEKNRIVIPSKFRKDFGKSVVIRIDFDNIITLQTVESFIKLINDKKFDDPFDAKLRQLKRMITLLSEELVIDSAGRIIIPDKFLSVAAIKTKNIVFIGVGDKVEIWEKVNFDNLIGTNPGEKLGTLAQEIADRG